MLDTVIRRTWVVDGTGNPARLADVAIEGDRIAAVGRLEGAQSAVVLDGRGKILAPGFIDTHSHSDFTVLTNPLAHSTVRQGITTEIVGNCGLGCAPVTERSLDGVRAFMATYGYDGPIAWRGYGSYLEHVEAAGSSQNLAFLAPHSVLRMAAGVSGSESTPDQRADMARALEEAMDAGAIGFSTGLEYSAGLGTPTGEVVALAPISGRRGGIYASHIRNRDAGLMAAIEEFITIARAGDMPGEVSHLNVRYNTGAPEGAWEAAVERIERERRSGLDILADTTPFIDGDGLMSGVLPPWLLAGGPRRAAELLADPEVRERVRTDTDRYWRFLYRGDWHRARVRGNRRHPEFNNMTFPEVAALMGHTDPWDAYFDLLAEAGDELATLEMVGELFTEAHVADMVRHPLFMFGVDAFTTAVDGPLVRISTHPLPFAGMMHFLTYHWRERRTVRLEDAIRKMTSMPARHFGLDRRGVIERGAYADLVLFNPDGLEEVSTLEKPVAYARGMDRVWVNGELVLSGEEHMGLRPGRVLRRA